MPLAHPGDFGLVTAMLQAKPDFGFRICHTPFPLNHQGTKNTTKAPRTPRSHKETTIAIAIGIAIAIDVDASDPRIRYR